MSIGGSAAVNAGATIGGKGGVGATAGNVTINNFGASITTTKDQSSAIVAQSIGGSGGSGGSALTVSISLSGGTPVGAQATVGGTGGSGGTAGNVKVMESPRVIVATGGCGKSYLYTTNPDSATGDGLAMCWRAGASVSNMEFVQFHPTCFYNPAATGPEARSFLVSEAVRGEGAILVNGQGHQFVKDHDPRGSLAARDIVARAIDTEIKRTGAPCVFLDVSPLGDTFAKRFPFIHETLLSFGHDALKKPIPVVPAAHYQLSLIHI